MTTVIGIKLPNRVQTSPEFQNILSKHGCMIKTRIGLHSNCSSVCSSYGVILLEIVDNSEIVNLKKDLNTIEGLTFDIISL